VGSESELRPIYQGCRAITFALARLSFYVVIILLYYLRLLTFLMCESLHVVVNVWVYITTVSIQYNQSIYIAQLSRV